MTGDSFNCQNNRFHHRNARFNRQNDHLNRGWLIKTVLAAVKTIVSAFGRLAIACVPLMAMRGVPRGEFWARGILVFFGKKKAARATVAFGQCSPTSASGGPKASILRVGLKSPRSWLKVSPKSVSNPPTWNVSLNGLVDPNF